MPSKLTSEEISLFCNSVGIAPGELMWARRAVTDRFGLGPRGAWIMALIAKGAESPTALSDVLGIARNLITAELAPLLSAGLIASEKVPADKRRSRLSLTAQGQAVMVELDENIRALVLERLDGFTREEILQCLKVMQAFVAGQSRFEHRRK